MVTETFRLELIMSAVNFLYSESRELVSVIIPAYNRLEYIQECIDSVFEQTFSNIELIVVDDGSNDGTLQILESYGQQLILLQHPNGENRGQAAAINLGLKHAKGEYIAILDSDDYWSPHYLEFMVKYLKIKSKLGLVYSNGYAVNEKGKYLYLLLNDEHVERNRQGDILLDCYIPSPGCCVVRRSIYEIVGYLDESLRSAQDHDMLVRMAEKTGFGFCNEKLFFYRKHQDTISKKGLSMRWPNGFIILDKAMARVEYPKSIINKRKAVLNYRLAQALRTEGAIFRAMYCLVLSVILDPARAVKIITRQEIKY